MEVHDSRLTAEAQDLIAESRRLLDKIRANRELYLESNDRMLREAEEARETLRTVVAGG